MPKRVNGLTIGGWWVLFGVGAPHRGDRIMGRIVSVGSACALAFGGLAGGSLTQAHDAQPPISAAALPKLVLIKRDTPLDLIATREITSASAKAGDMFTLAVNTPVVIDGVTVIPFMTRATGEVTISTSAGGLGRNKSMAAHLLHLTLGDARIPITGEVANAGGGAGSTALAVAFGGVIGLFHRGNDGRIKAGQRVAAFVAEDVTLDLSAGVARRADMKLVPVGEGPVGSSPPDLSSPELPMPATGS